MPITIIGQNNSFKEQKDGEAKNRENPFEVYGMRKNVQAGINEKSLFSKMPEMSRL